MSSDASAQEDASAHRNDAAGSSDASAACEAATFPSVNDLRSSDAGDGVDGACDSAQCGVSNTLAIVNFTGSALTYSPGVPANGYIPTGASDFSGTYGTNGRSCFVCHSFDDGWTLTTLSVQQDFMSNTEVTSNDQLDPVFRTNDGSNSPDADVSTPTARTAAYSMLFNRAVIRVGIGMPKNAEFTLTTVEDPYGFASAGELSLFRRPLPTQNLSFESDIMWDGRETVGCQPVSLDIQNQANHATLTHAAAAAPLAEVTRQAILDFERLLFAAQVSDFNAGSLTDEGALGGPVNLAATPFYIGINDLAGADPRGTAFNPIVFTLFDAWSSLPPSDAYAAARASVVRGQRIFNTRTFSVTGVRGLNDDLGQATVAATCSTCHDTPNVGNSSLAHRYDIGVSDASQRTPDLPLYTFTNNATGEVIQTSDPGRALISGRWKDMSRFKVPALRNLAARFPLLHNGGAPLVVDAVKFHDERFNIGLSSDETTDLVTFLQVL